MKKIFFTLLMTSCALVYSQINRFVYQVTIKTDPNNPTETTTENAYLDISSEKSMFYAENKIKRDSLLKIAFESGAGRASLNRETMQGLRSKMNYTIEKDKKTLKTTMKDRIGADLYAYVEDREIEWKITPETTKIGEYTVQKAQTNFAGRVWNAWFTTDLPYQDGPYKFSGLPGLIIKVEDSEGMYSFDLMKNYKINEFPVERNFGTVLKVKRADYNKQMEKFLKDPMSSLSQGNGFRMGRGNQEFTLSPEMKKRMEERVKQEMKNYTNPIELN